MIFFKGRSRRIKERAPLPPRLARPLRESRWLLLVAVAFYLILVLATYDKADPGWSHSAVSVDPVHNAGGRFGAWLADLLLYLFGVSAYWTALFLAFATWWGYRHIQTAGDGDRRPFWIASSGFVLLLLSSAVSRRCVCIRSRSRCRSSPAVPSE